jgi:hypothetical protein
VFYIKEKMQKEPTKHFRVDEQGVLWFNDRLVVPKNRELKNQIMDEAHLSKLSIHLGSSKTYQDLRPRFWWTKMKKEIAAYVARCDTCCRVKAIHMKPAGLLQPLSISDWQWENISMDFITGLPTTQKGNDSIWVIVDRSLTFYLLKLSIDHLNMLTGTLQKLFDCMVCQKPLCLTKGLNSQLTFGSTCTKVWVPVWFIVPLIILKL